MTDHSRRAVLAGLAAVLSGCSATGDTTPSDSPTPSPSVTFAATPAETATPQSTDTPTRTESPTETDSPTPTETETATEEPTETPDEVERAIRESRADLETAISVLDEADALKNGEVVPGPDGDYPTVENYGDVQIPVDRAMDRLDRVSDRAGEHRSTVNALLLFGGYVRTKLSIVANLAGMLNVFGPALQAYPGGGSVDSLGTALHRVRELYDESKRATDRLDRIESFGGVPGVDNTSVAAEREDRALAAGVARRYLPGVRGANNTTVAVSGVETVRGDLDRGNYATAAKRAKIMSKAGESAIEDISTALERGISPPDGRLEAFRCIARGMVDVHAELRQAAEAYPDNPDEGKRHREAADRLVAKTERDCARVLPL